MAIVWDDLMCGGLGIFRDSESFTYGHDAVLLSEFAHFSPKDRFVDLGAGCGILSLLIWAKTKTPSLAVDISEDCISLIKMSVERNGLTGEIETLCSDMRRLSVNDTGVFDGAVCNPPYFSGGTKTEDPSRLTSKFQVTCTLRDAAEAAARLVKNGGNLFMCYPADKTAVLCYELIRAGFSPKRLKFIGTSDKKPPRLVLAEAKKGGGDGCRIEI